MSKYLIDEYPLVLLPTLAKKIGLNEAIFVQQVHYFLSMKINPRDGYYWTYNTYEEWLKQFPFWSLSTLKRIVNGLEERGLIISGNYNKMVIDKTKWYRIDYDLLSELTKDIETFNGKVEESRIAQNDTSNVSKWNVEGVNMSKAIPNTTTNTTTNKKNKDIVQDELERDFEEFWSHYPKKTAKKVAFASYKKAIKNKNTHEKIMEGLFLYLQQIKVKGTSKDFIAQPATYLNQERFNDEYDLSPQQRSPYQQPQTFRFSEVAQEQPQINKWGIE